MVSVPVEIKNGRRPPVPPSHGVAWIFLMMVIIALIIFQLMFYTWCRVQCRHIGYEISSEISRFRKMNEWQNQLRIELEHLKSPERIAGIAATRLGFVMPSPQQKRMVILDESLHERD